uniref:Dihydroxy-acid dehydratase n=1 Tax=OCS116 cluster bacterium TaxID=2030921 RepID=A0A2A4ZA66_9PROT
METNRDDRSEIDVYGMLPWVCGIAMAAIILGIMFWVAAPIS